MNTIEAEGKAEELKGLGGWLIFPAIGMFLTIPVALYALNGLSQLFANGGWQALTNPDSKIYDPMWGPTLLFNISASIFLLCLDITALTLFFRKSPVFPYFYIAFTSTNVVITCVLYGLTRSIAAAPQETVHQLPIEIFKAVVSACIWIPYMLVSKRVKNTFVKPGVHADLTPIASGG